MSTEQPQPTSPQGQQPSTASKRLADMLARSPAWVKRFYVEVSGEYYAPAWMTIVAGLLALALLVSLGFNIGQRASMGGAATASHDMGGTMMGQPAYAKDMNVAITSPANGTRVTSNTVVLAVTSTGFTPTCDLAGKANQQGTGHYHILLDKSLVNMFCTPTATISMQNVAHGIHTLTAVPTVNDHTEIEENASSMKIDYEPTGALPTITDAKGTSAPTIKILSPTNGATVTGAFDVVVQVTNFHLSCDLMGKPDVAGYGHWHINLDSASGPMMGMGTMLGMSCDTTFHATTAGLKGGQTHTIIALLTDNGHAPLHPAVASEVMVMIGG